MIRFSFFISLALIPQLQAQELTAELLWDLEKLSKAPEAEWGETKDLVQEVYYAGEPFNGKPTRVFAYVGRPEGEGPFPGVVLAHGGGGQAFDEWARHWAKRGYVSISMDTAGCGPGKKRLEDGGPDQGGETKFRNFAADEAREMWTYHAVADVILAHSLLRSLPECDANRTALTGISWGGYLTCITSGIDTRFKASVPVYGCGFLHVNSTWKDKQLAAMDDDSRKRWINLFDPGKHVGRVQFPMLFFNGTNDFAYPLDAYKHTVQEVKPELTTVAIHLRLRHGHIWSFGIVDAFIDSHLRDTPDLARIGEIKMDERKATAKILTDTLIKGAEMLYAEMNDGPWQKFAWKTAPAEFVDGEIRSEIPKAERPVAFILQAIDERGFRTSSLHAIYPNS